MSALIEISDLVVRRGKRSVVEIKALTVEKGEILAVIGPNGAGKSSLLLAMARLLQPDKGELWWDGVSLKEIDHKTMQSKIIDNLFFAGEVIDVDGKSGGFNLQLCWSTGYIAGGSQN